MSVVLIDSHCHLDADEFDSDRTEIIARAQAAGVIAQVIPAVTAAKWPKLRTICTQTQGLYPAYGLHPIFLTEHHPTHLHALRDWVERERPCAIGECGLDFHLQGLNTQLQHTYFISQLILSREYALPVIVHARHAVEQVITSIKTVGKLRGVIHSFSGSVEQARQLWKLGFMISLGGALTYTRANRLHRLAVEIPLDYLLLETDAPYQPDSEIRGQRNEPGRLPAILDYIATLRKQDRTEISKVTSANTERLFGLKITPT
ncbi:TatD family deoxyribonuclease [Xylella taiwanensis]|uniref:DNAase n=1 Tax=Xylella taiwanensis TaxID=1444770 RepID=Z9JKI0_9GAMM|nr:TatD family hydrolase [Xylella taiwanensis]AXI82615.1 DNAase [Xylella taiwanensis]EWS78262.1 DNAase [Xylella taiwanensis]MCD8455610.1 TatD family hydrolase [Xylella taiwanensis]MCD8458017.1 TatD family hydrolase [Xylella taiwanensis]MCD8460153.1 TatD family hydrolase [Xylella taiwanensis]